MRNSLGGVAVRDGWRVRVVPVEGVIVSLRAFRFWAEFVAVLALSAALFPLKLAGLGVATVAFVCWSIAAAAWRLR